MTWVIIFVAWVLGFCLYYFRPNPPPTAWRRFRGLGRLPPRRTDRSWVNEAELLQDMKRKGGE